MWHNPIIFGVIVALCTFPVVLGQSCGDGICITGGASSEISTCPQDCNPTCGDGVCAKSAYPPQNSETVTNCPKDCVATCGDGVCARVPMNASSAETATNCPKDCVPTCGDGVCSTAPLSNYTKETTSSCSKDCAPSCGDGVCATAPASGYTGESGSSCPRDCTSFCGDGVCAVVPTSGIVETATNCAKDCAPTCGDSVCSTAPLSSYQKEAYTTCPQDCNPVCGDGLCEGLENCLNCPKDCGCKFNGGKVTLYQCAPNNITLSTCVNSTFSSTLPAFASIAAGVNFITVKYTSYLQPPSSKYSGNFMFLINATNVGARLFINDKKLIDAYFPQDNIFTTAKALLPSKLIHKLDLEFYSMSASAPRNVNLMWRDLNDPSSTFTTINETYYSINNCGDHIFDTYESTTTCFKDFDNCHLASCRNTTDQCGDGICLEQAPEDCFVDCHQFLTTQCSSIGAKPGFLSQNLPVEVDTLGDLIRNQMLWHLPGLEHMQYGINIVTGEAAGAPLFYFGYCSDNIGETIQDTYRGNLYTLPSEIYAQPAPKCQYSATATSFSSSIKMANSFALDSGMEASGEAGGSWDGIGAKASFSYSQESSVKSARQMEQKQSGSLILTEVMCATSKVQMNKYTFHTSFLQELSRVNSSDEILDMIDKYGTHFYQRATLGGKLRQVTSVSKSHASSKTKTELEQNSQKSFAASVTSPVFSVSGDYSDSVDSSISASDQQTFERASTRSTVITYGGPPGSFGPSSSEAPSNFGDWASSVDLLPVPIKYELKRISDIIPSEWKARNGTSLQSLWKQGELLWKERQIIYEADGNGPNRYTLYWNWDYDSAFTYTGPYLPRPTNEQITLTVQLVNGTTDSFILMDETGPSGSYVPFSFYDTDYYRTNNPARFDLFSVFQYSNSSTLAIRSNAPEHTYNNVPADGTGNGTFLLHDWQTGLSYKFSNPLVQAIGYIMGPSSAGWYDTHLNALSTLVYMELQSSSGGIILSSNTTDYMEITVYFNETKHTYTKKIPQVNVYADTPSPIFLNMEDAYECGGSCIRSAIADGAPYKIDLKIGQRPLGIRDVSLVVKNFWVQVSRCLGDFCGSEGNGVQPINRVFSMEPLSSVRIDSSQGSSPTTFTVDLLSNWL